MFFASVWTDIVGYATSEPISFYTIVIAVVLVLTALSSALVIGRAKRNRERALYEAMAVIERADEYASERENKRLAEQEKERAKRAKPTSDATPEQELEIVENTGENGKSDDLTKVESMGENTAEQSATEGVEVEL